MREKTVGGNIGVLLMVGPELIPSHKVLSETQGNPFSDELTRTVLSPFPS